MGFTAAAIDRQRTRREFDIDSAELSRDTAVAPLPPEAAASIPSCPSLRALLAPVDEVTFVRQWLGREILHLSGRGPMQAHQQIFSRELLMDGIRRHRVPPTMVSFFDGLADPSDDKDVREYARSNFTQDPQGTRLDYRRVHDYLSRGRGTLVVYDVGQWFDGVREFEAGLGEVTGSRVQTTAYYTPAGGKLYPAHWDAHDVLAIQIMGRKHWRCWQTMLEAPLPDRGYMQSTPYPGFEAELPWQDRVLSEGDVLYFPAGVPHAAWTTDEPSLHLTVAISPPRWHALFDAVVRRAMTECEKDLDFRRPCPALMLGSDHPQVVEHRRTLQQRLAHAVASVDLDEVLAEHFASRSHTFPTIDPEAPTVGLDTPLRRPAGLTVLRERDDRVELWVADECLSFPSRAGPALRWLRTHSLFTPRDLPQLDDDERLVVAQRLVTDGVLALA